MFNRECDGDMQNFFFIVLIVNWIVFIFQELIIVCVNYCFFFLQFSLGKENEYVR